MSKTETTVSGIGFPGLLALLFIGLKLGHVITWPWVWVLAPLWIPIVLVLGVLAVIFTVLGIGLLASNKK